MEVNSKKAETVGIGTPTQAPTQAPKQAEMLEKRAAEKCVKELEPAPEEANRSPVKDCAIVTGILGVCGGGLYGASVGISKLSGFSIGAGAGILAASIFCGGVEAYGQVYK